jgi:glyoxylase-like metal-dependent hydrolase (beta-lactamase superfamily II)
VARDLEAELCPELGEERQMVDGIELVRSLAGTDVVVCGHGGLQEAARDAPRWKKGSTLVVDAELNIVEVREV